MKKYLHILIKISAFVDEFYLLLVKRTKLQDPGLNPGFSQLGGLGFSSSITSKHGFHILLISSMKYANNRSINSKIDKSMSIFFMMKVGNMGGKKRLG